MKTLKHLAVAFLTFWACGVLADTNSAGTFPLIGKAVDPQGNPVPGAVVVQYQYDEGIFYGRTEPERTGETVTDAKGGFELRVSRKPELLLARKPGFAPAWKLVMATPGTKAELVFASPALIAGLVVDEAGKPVAKAEVFVSTALSDTSSQGGRSFNILIGKSARECFSARTTADGRFRIEGFPTNATAILAVRVPGKTLRAEGEESLNHDSLPFHAGQDDIRLVVEPAGSIEGKITFEGQQAPLPKAWVTLQPDGPGFMGLASFDPVPARADGTFAISDVAAGGYRVNAVFNTNGVPDWVAASVPASVETGSTTRDVQISATRGGLLEVSVIGDSDRKPRAQVTLHAYSQKQQASAISDNNGVARLRLPPGSYQIVVSEQNGVQNSTSASIEDGATNRIEMELASPKKITGVVRGPNGEPAAGLPVRVVGNFGMGESDLKTDASGKFEMEWSPRHVGQNESTSCILIRDPDRNLAVAQDLDEDAGPLDLKLSPGLTLAGRAECDGKPVTNATAALVFWAGNSGMHLQGLCRGTNVPGAFEIPALPPGHRYGLYVSAPGYGQKFVNAVETGDEAKRVEIDPVELKPANLKLAGKVVDADDKPVSGVYVNLNGEGQPNGNARTDREGRFEFKQVCEGAVRLFANARNQQGNISAEGGDTNVVLKLGESSSQSFSSGEGAKKLKGIVTDPQGKPVLGAQVAVFPTSGNGGWIKTDTNGAFNLRWSIQSWQLDSGGDPVLVVRDSAHNLAAIETLDPAATNMNVQLRPAVTLTGRVEKAGGAPLANAQIGVWLLACRSYSELNEQMASTDANGNFEIKTVPTGSEYTVFAKAKDHGRSQQSIETSAETNRIQLETFVLKAADKVVAGQVLNQNEKPAPGVHVSLSGGDQPDGSMTTDSNGRFSFKVCEGQIQLYASGQNAWANATVEAGDTNVVIQLASNSSSVERQAPKRSSLKDKPLPDLASVGLPAEATATGKPLLLCLIDAEQRPSRYVARTLASQAEALKQKGIAVAIIQASVVTADSWQTWTNSSPMPFAVGRVADASAGTKWATEVPSLPWFILRDAGGKVVAEGFALDELDAKLGELKK